MATAAIVYHSGAGHTEIMAGAARDGANRVGGVDARLFEIERRHIVEGRYENESLLGSLDGADAIVFACPTYMG